MANVRCPVSAVRSPRFPTNLPVKRNIEIETYLQRITILQGIRIREEDGVDGPVGIILNFGNFSFYLVIFGG